MENDNSFGKCEAHGEPFVRTPVGFICPKCYAENKSRAIDGGDVLENTSGDDKDVEYRDRRVVCCPVHGDNVPCIRVTQNGALLVGPVCAACLNDAVKTFLPATTESIIREPVDKSEN